MKDIIPYFIGVLIGMLIIGSILWSSFSDKLKKARKHTNYHIRQFLLYGDIHAYMYSLSSFLNSICLLRSEYITNDKKNALAFDQQAENFIIRFIDTQTEALELLDKLQRGVMYVDPEVIRIVINAINLRKEKVIALFEEKYTFMIENNTPALQKEFINAVRCSYFLEIKLEHRFYTRIEELEKKHANVLV